MPKVLSAQPDSLRGLVRLAAQPVPNGGVVVTRKVGNKAPETIRGGTFDATTGGFIRSDPEPLFGADLTYRVVDTVASRNIQTNRVLNPKFATGITNWTVDASRTSARETGVPLPPRDAVTSLRIGPRTTGPGAGGLTERLLTRCSPSGFTTGRWYVSGQLRYDSPDIWLWDDVRAAGTWQTVRNKGTWQTVKATQSTLAGQAFASLYVGVLNDTGATVLTAPFQILGVQASDNGGWATFQGYVDVPAGAPANCQLAFYQGTQVREYAVTWWLTTIMVTPEAEVSVQPYFDGDSPLAPLGDLGDRLAPGYDWKALSGDGGVSWSGTPNASWSQLTGPSQIFAEVVTAIGRPTAAQLPRVRLPIFLSDPVAPQLSQWFELVEQGDLTFGARQQLFDVLSRRFQIAVSQLRAEASGQLRLMTYTPETQQMAERLFGTGRILYWRNPDPRFPENGWYVALGDVASGRPGATVAWAPERLWSVPFVRVERPAGLIAASTSISWGTVKGAYTWQQLRDAREDWLDAAVTTP